MPNTTRNLLGVLALVIFAFTFFQASWLADKPEGGPLLIADHGVDPVRDKRGCVTQAALGWGASGAVGRDVASLQSAAGSEADAIHITTEAKDGALRIARQFKSECAADEGRPHGTIAEAISALGKPLRIWDVANAADAALLLAALPAPKGDVNDAFVGSDTATVAAIKKARPGAWAFDIATARQCASDYKLSGIWGSVPAGCANGTMLLEVGELGYTLWGWPNRFLARMNDAGTHVVIAESIEGKAIRGLEKVQRYGDIANSFNGYIWIDNIQELGPALRR